MDPLMIGLRIVHIVSAILWVGAAAMFLLYIQPTVRKLGPDGEKFVNALVNERKLPVYFGTISTLTVLAGVTLYWRIFGGINTSSSYGVALGLGGLAAIIAWPVGNLLIPRALDKVSAVATEMNAAGGPPPAELMGRMRAAQRRLRLTGITLLVLLAFAAVAMSTAQYLR